MQAFKHSATIIAAFLLGFAVSTQSKGAEFFVSPMGDDSNQGSIDHPFASITKAQKTVSPGDIIHLRGGVYRIQGHQLAIKDKILGCVFVMDKNGRPDAPITYAAYQNEIPVFDFSEVKPKGLRVIAFQVTGSWLRFKGFEVTGIQVTIKDHTQSECFENRGSNNVYERLVMHDGKGIGFYLVSGSNNLILNCDAYRNHDDFSEDGRGGNTDGFGCHARKGAVGNVFKGCRAWFNSDDGFDCISSWESVTFVNCWAFYNGFSPNLKRLADGNGFKVGGWGFTPSERLPPHPPRHTVRNCLAAGNKANGFYANHHLIGGEWLNNTSYGNDVNFNMMMRVNDANGTGFRMDAPGFGQTLVRNLGYRGRKETDFIDGKNCELQGNLFDTGNTLSASDFASLDEGQLLLPRKSDGSLPEITFLHPVAGKPAWQDGIPGCFGPVVAK